MITPQHVQIMARYNQWQNQSLYREADKLTDEQRKADRGAFFKSIHGTLNHLLWGDRLWMVRFGNWSPPQAKSISESVNSIDLWDDLKRERSDIDQRLIDWAGLVEASALQGDITWYSGSRGADVTRPKWALVTHMFNHQTHHRGQVHALLTGYGLKPDDTDIPFMPSW